MSNNSWAQTVLSQQAAGAALTAAASASMLSTLGQGKLIFPANQLQNGGVLSIRAAGIISCAVTTPGTARFDIRWGATVIFDTGALNLNTVAKVNVPWWLDIELVARSTGGGTNCTFWGQGLFVSEAVINSPLPAVGGNGALNVPVSGLAVSTGVDSSISNVIDSNFTQTVATGSLTCQLFKLVYGN